MSNIFGPILDDAAAGFALFMQGNRSIGDIIPDVVTREVHHDPAQLTSHPVETGSPVTDHMFFLPQTVEMEPAWSDSSPWGAPGFSASVYAQLVALQQTRKPFNLVTGKRQYSNMQIRDIVVKTDVESENSLIAVVIFQQIIFVSVSGGSSSGGGSSSTTPTDGASQVATAGSISAANASSAGLAVDANGGVSFPNMLAPGGNIQTVETTQAPTIAAAGGSHSP